MPRPIKPRWVNFDPHGYSFVPQHMIPPSVDRVLLTIDELEALRLADLGGLSQEVAADSMSISRATFGRIVAQARRKVADALVHGKGICIAGGTVRFRPPYGRMGGNRPGSGPGGSCVCPSCGTLVPHQQGAPCSAAACPNCGSALIKK